MNLEVVATWKNGKNIYVGNSEDIEKKWNTYFFPKLKKILKNTKRDIKSYKTTPYHKKISSAINFHDLEINFNKDLSSFNKWVNRCYTINRGEISYMSINEKMLINFVNSIFSHTKISFILKHFYIQKIFYFNGLNYKKLFVVKIDEKLFSFFKLTDFFYTEKRDEFISYTNYGFCGKCMNNYFTDMFDETEINKELKEKEMKDRFESCMNLYYNLEMVRSYHKKITS